MPYYKGTFYARDIFIENESAVPVDVSTWDFWMQIRDSVYDDVLLELTSANGGVETVDGAAGNIRIIIDLPYETVEEWPDGKVVFDMMRMNADTAPTFLFSGQFKVKTPVTRDG